MHSTVPSATLKLFLVLGDPKRLRTAELSNWTGRAVAGPRSDFEEIINRKEAQTACIYFLIGSDPETAEPTLYIGEGESFKDRMTKAHNEFDSWSRLIFFTSSDQHLTKAHILYIEAQMIGLARQADRFRLKNKKRSEAYLPESDEADMQIFISKMLQILPVLGLDAFSKPADAASVEKGLLLTCAIKGCIAQGYLSPEGLTVLKGSQAVLAERASAQEHPTILNQRRSLVADGALVEQNGYLVFTKEVEFSSASAAAVVIHGGNANGLTCWKDSSGLTLKEKEQPGCES